MAKTAVRSKAVTLLLLLIHWFIVAPIVCSDFVFGHWFVMQCPVQVSIDKCCTINLP